MKEAKTEGSSSSLHFAVHFLLFLIINLRSRSKKPRCKNSCPEKVKSSARNNQPKEPKVVPHDTQYLDDRCDQQNVFHVPVYKHEGKRLEEKKSTSSKGILSQNCSNYQQLRFFFPSKFFMIINFWSIYQSVSLPAIDKCKYKVYSFLPPVYFSVLISTHTHKKRKEKKTLSCRG